MRCEISQRFHYHYWYFVKKSRPSKLNLSLCLLTQVKLKTVYSKGKIQTHWTLLHWDCCLENHVSPGTNGKQFLHLCVESTFRRWGAGHGDGYFHHNPNNLAGFLHHQCRGKYPCVANFQNLNCLYFVGFILLPATLGWTIGWICVNLC